MSSKSKTLFQGLPKCSQVPAGEVSSDSVTLALLLKMRAVGCLIPQCVPVCLIDRYWMHYVRRLKLDRGMNETAGRRKCDRHQKRVGPLHPDCFQTAASPVWISLRHFLLQWSFFLCQTMEELFLLKSKPRVAKGEEVLVFLNNKLEVSLFSSVSTLMEVFQLRPLTPL